MNSPQSTLVIINPNSRNGDVSIAQAVEILRKLGPVIFVDSASPAETRELVHKFKKDAARIVVGGGDGTLRSSLELVLDLKLPLGVLPLGTANDFANSLNIPTELNEAAAVIARQATRAVDVGCVNGEYFLNAVGIGLGPQMTRELDADIKRRFGVIAYAARLFKALSENEPIRAMINCDDQKYRLKSRQITIANGISYGGGMRIAPDAQLDDGKLDILIVSEPNIASLLVSGPSLRRGDVNTLARARQFRGDRVSVDTRPSVDVSVDGELLLRTPIECEVLRGALQVYAPATEAVG